MIMIVEQVIRTTIQSPCGFIVNMLCAKKVWNVTGWWYNLSTTLQLRSKQVVSMNVWNATMVQLVNQTAAAL